MTLGILHSLLSDHQQETLEKIYSSLWLPPETPPMTEHDWLISTNPAEMAEFILGRPGATYSGVGGLNPAKRISDRQMRLYGAAAAGLSGAPELFKESWVEWADLLEDSNKCTGFSTLQGFNYWCSSLNDVGPGDVRADILRDLVGNPWKSAKKTIGTWRHLLSWHNKSIPKLATAVYENLTYNRLDNDRLLVLGDALEEAGCTDEEVLNHLRGLERCNGVAGEVVVLGDGLIARNKPRQCLFGMLNVDTVEPNQLCPTCKGKQWVDGSGLHFKGCWVIDLILGLN